MTLLDIVEKWISGDWGKESPCEDAQNQICCIRGADIVPIANVDFNDIPMRFVSERSLTNRSLKEGDIVIEKSGGSPTQSTGRVAFVSEELIDAKGPILCSNFCSAFRVRSGWNPKYIYYYLQYFYGLGTFFNFEGKTSGLKNLDVENAFTAIVVPSASKNEQDKVEEILSTIDRKIALNRKRIATLEAMAKEIYDYWFVQFDFPDAHGRPYKSSGGAMVYNPDLKREIPKGWEVKRIGDVLSKIPSTEKVPTVNYSDIGIIPIIDQSEKFIAGYTDNDAAALDLKSCVVFGDHSCTVKYVNFRFARGADGTQILHSNTPLIDDTQLYFTLLGMDFDEGYKRHFSALKDKLLVISSDASLTKKYMSVVDVIFAQIRALRQMSNMLVAFRDFLLPVLMNGQVKVA